MRRSVESARVQQEPYLVWNAFIDLLAGIGSEGSWAVGIRVWQITS